MLKASGADVILMDLQYAPMVLASPYYSSMEAIISEVAREEKVGLFSRLTLMRKSIEAVVSPSALVSWDGLHKCRRWLRLHRPSAGAERFKFGSVRDFPKEKVRHRKEGSPLQVGSLNRLSSVRPSRLMSCVCREPYPS
jgi:hypothetical protein